MSTTIDIATDLAMLLAAPDNTKGPEFGKASPLGLLVILLLLAGTALLIRSMNTQLRRLPDTFDAEHPEADQAFDEGTDKVSIPADPAGGTDAGASDDATGTPPSLEK